MEKEIDDKFEKNQDSDQNIKETSVFNKTEETGELSSDDKLKDTGELSSDDKLKDTGELSSDDKLKDTQEKLLRALAETENQRRRFEKETSEAFEYGGFNLARETLSVLDNLQRAYQSIKNDNRLKDNKDLNKFLENIKIIEKDLVTIFEKNNIKKINCLKEKFDPNNHQAMLEIEDENVSPGTVLQEIQPGYFYKERLLRPSFVAIAKKKAVNAEEKEEKK